ncbi:MAG TPA: hypothetical protein VM032_08610 [Vicinamibacterales bacterium]|nr:hypothetical protein [Vicinamibacterales bacterium]
MNRAILVAHGWIAWLGLALVVAALVPHPRFEARRDAWARRSRSRIAGALVLLQLASGWILYARYSPYTAGLRANLDVALHDPLLRYWNVVHPLAGTLVCAVALWKPLQWWRPRDSAAGWLRLALLLAAAVVLLVERLWT